MFEIRLITALVLAVPVQVLKRLYRELILHIDFSPTKKNTVRTVVCLIHSDRYMGWEMVFYIFWGGEQYSNTIGLGREKTNWSQILRCPNPDFPSKITRTRRS